LYGFEGGKMDDYEPLNDAQNPKTTVFLLTKPPKSNRARICLQLIKRSENAVLYLVGDGVYNLLDEAFEALPRERIFVCSEDLEARGIQPEGGVAIPSDFYERLVEDLMLDENRVYTF
jgi:sulfur relay protein TusB/DsrH